MIQRIFVFILATGLGLAILKYTLQFVGMVGKSQWAETKLGMGASYTIWKIIGILLIIFGVLVLLGRFELVPNLQVEKPSDSQFQFQ